MNRPRRLRSPLAWWRDPWRAPHLLLLVTLVYVLWSLVPVIIAIVFSFNDGRSRTTWQGFSLRWYFGDDRSLFSDPSLHTALTHTLVLGIVSTIIAVPVGVAFALGIDRWRGRIPNGLNGLMLLSFVLPEILLAVALLFLITQIVTPFTLGTWGQVAGLVTYQLSYPAIIVRARLLTIGKQYEEAATDMGASPFGAVRRVLLPMLVPAILASAVLVFADVVDDFVIVRYLSADAASEPTSVKIYNSARAAPTPALNALATVTLLAALTAVVIGFLVHRRMTRGEGKDSGIDGFASQL